MTRQTYPWSHRKERARLAPTVDAGHAHCTEARCLEVEDGGTRWIPPGTPWDLAHDRDTGTYLGPAHQRCNRAEGAHHGNHTNQPPARWDL